MTTTPADAEVVSLSRAQRERRERIVLAAVELLGDHDYDAIHMRVVAERAGVALGTLYRYFPSKEQLFGAALSHWARSFERRYHRAIATSASTPAERLKATLRTAVAAFERNPRFFGLVVVLQSSDVPEVAGLYDEFTSTTTGVVRDALAGVAPEAVAPMETIVLAVLFSLLRAWSLGAATIAEVQARLDECVDVVFGGPFASVEERAWPTSAAWGCRCRAGSA